MKSRAIEIIAGVYFIICAIAAVMLTWICVFGNTASSPADLNRDANEAYRYAIITRYDGEQKLNVKSWSVDDGMIQITTIDGDIYTVDRTNVMFVSKD